MEEGVELAGVLLKRSPGTDDASGAGAANSSAPNKSLAVDYSQKTKQKYEVEMQPHGHYFIHTPRKLN